MVFQNWEFENFDCFCFCFALSVWCASYNTRRKRLMNPYMTNTQWVNDKIRTKKIWLFYRNDKIRNKKKIIKYVTRKYGSRNGKMQPDFFLRVIFHDIMNNDTKNFVITTILRNKLLKSWFLIYYFWFHEKKIISVTLWQV